MNYTKEQLDKLPKWARFEIERLSSDLLSANKKLDQFSGKSKTDIYINDGLSRIPLPSGSRIEMMVGLNRISAEIVDGGVRIYVISNDGSNTAILPEASNVFLVKLVK